MSFALSQLNPEQRAAVAHEDGPLLILAGAGTGKTRTITARIAWLLQGGADPSKITAVTFTNKAAREMRERIAGMVDPESARLLTVSTFHALCMRILRGHAHLLGYKDNFSIFDAGDQLGLIKKIATRVCAKDESIDPNHAKNLISKAKNNGWGPPGDEETVAGAIYRRYQQDLRALNAMDFDDLLVNAVKVLGDDDAVRKKWQSRSKHLLVDEFQDTNRLQLDLVTLLANGAPPDVCVVGDDDQSIYGWRGAEISNILEFEKHFPHPTIVRLERNYRSREPILAAANRLIRHNPRRREKRLVSHLGNGEPVRFLGVPDDRKEAEFVVGEIASHQSSEKIPWDHFAVLYRMNAQSRLLEEELRKQRIPYRLVGGKSFYERREVKDLIAYLSFLLNPSHDPSLLRIIATPPRGIGAGTVQLALAFSADHRIALVDAFRQPDFLEGCSGRARSAIARFLDEMDAARIRLTTPGSDPAAIAREILADCGYLDDLRRSCKSPEEALNRAENVSEMLRTLSEHSSEKGLRDFLDSVAIDREREEDRQENAAGVTLITLHAAKGLEFPHVFLIGAEDGLLPHERSKLENSVDEERRLFYVGITRAMESLVITWCRERLRYGSPMACRPSPFLKEILGEGVEEASYEGIVNRPLSTDDIAMQLAELRASLAAGQD